MIKKDKRLEAVEKWLKKEKRSITFLAGLVGVSSGHLHKVLRGKKNRLTDSLWVKLKTITFELNGRGTDEA